MRKLRSLIIRFRGLFNKQRKDREFEEEIESHLQLHIEDNLRLGLTAEEARRQAMIKLGGIESTREAYRDQRGLPALETVLQDVRYGLRTLRKNRGFTTVAVLTLALGIGANTAVFSLIDSALIRPLPYRDAHQLLDLAEITPTGQRNNVSGGVFKDWAQQSTLLADISIYNPVTFNLTGGETPERVAGLEVTSRYLPVLGVQPMVGTGFAADADAVGGNGNVIILAHHFWRDYFAGDAGIAGKSVSLDRIPYTIIGVLPPNALLDNDAKFLVPVVIKAYGPGRWSRTDGNWWARVIGRAKPGVTANQVNEELKSIKQRLADEYPARAKEWNVVATQFQETITAKSRPIFIILLCTVSLVLLIACINVGNLLLARANARAREMAIRSALGARSTRLFRQMLTESGLLAVAGCGVGLGLAVAGLELIKRLMVDLLPLALRPELDLRVFAYSVLISCVCALLFGLLPALRAGRSDLNLELKESERGATGSARMRSQSILIVGEVAFTLLLLVGAGLSIRGFAKLQSADLGFNPHGTLAFDLSFPSAKYVDFKARKQFMGELETRLTALPGVQFAGFASTLPLSGKSLGEPLARPGRPANGNYFVGADMVSHDFLAAMGMPVLRGRPFNQADFARDVPNVCVISQGVTRDLFPGEDPLGQQVVFWGATMEVVGVVDDVHHNDMGMEPRTGIYLPGLFPKNRDFGLVVRASVAPLSLIKAVRAAISALDPDLPIANIRTLDHAVYRAMGRWRTTLILLGIFALIAVSLACIGLYGVISYSVNQRQREFGIRIALGAQRGNILRLIIGRGLTLTLAGMAIGIAAALAAGSLLSSQVFGIAPKDLPVTVCATSIMFIVALLAAYIPAQRATRMDPIRALRND